METTMAVRAPTLSVLVVTLRPMASVQHDYMTAGIATCCVHWDT